MKLVMMWALFIITPMEHSTRRHTTLSSQVGNPVASEVLCHTFRDELLKKAVLRAGAYAECRPVYVPGTVINDKH